MVRARYQVFFPLVKKSRLLPENQGDRGAPVFPPHPLAEDRSRQPRREAHSLMIETVQVNRQVKRLTLFSLFAP